MSQFRVPKWNVLRIFTHLINDSSQTAQRFIDKLSFFQKLSLYFALFQSLTSG